jgi:EmrB/QacA subfamily drug resistance transporter
MSSSHRLVLVATALAIFMAFLDATIVNVAFPAIARDFSGTSRADLSWVLGAYNIVFAALLVPAGRLADLTGRKRVFMGGVVVFVAGSVLCGLATSPAMLIGFRVFQAVGAAALVPASQALLMAAYPPGKRATVIGIWGAAAAVAAAAGPSVGGVLVHSDNWRLIFFVNVPLGFAAWLIGRRALTESRNDARSLGRPDLGGAALITASVGLLALAIVQGETWGWTSARVLGAFAAAALLLPVFVWRSWRHPAPAVDIALFRIRSFAASNAATLIFSAAFYGMLLCNILFLTSVWGYSVLVAGLATTPPSLIAAAVAGPGGKLAERYGHRAVAVPGALMLAGAMVWWTTHAGTSPNYLKEWVPGMLLSGTGGGLAYPTLTSAAVTDLPSERFGVGSAVNATMRQLGAVLGVAMVVALIGAPSPGGLPAAFDRAWIFGAAAAVSAALAAVAIGQTTVSARLPARGDVRRRIVRQVDRIRAGEPDPEDVQGGALEV